MWVDSEDKGAGREGGVCPLALSLFPSRLVIPEEQRFLLDTVSGLTWSPRMGVLKKLTKPTAQAAQGCRELAKRTKCQISVGGIRNSIRMWDLDRLS